jgi:hypothetical protein
MGQSIGLGFRSYTVVALSERCAFAGASFGERDAHRAFDVGRRELSEDSAYCRYRSRLRGEDLA